MSDRHYETRTTLHREEGPLRVDVLIRWDRTPDRSWLCRELTVTEASSLVLVTLTESETEHLQERYHPNKFPDPRDNF